MELPQQGSLVCPSSRHLALCRCNREQAAGHQQIPARRVGTSLPKERAGLLSRGVSFVFSVWKKAIVVVTLCVGMARHRTQLFNPTLTEVAITGKAWLTPPIGFFYV